MQYKRKDECKCDMQWNNFTVGALVVGVLCIEKVLSWIMNYFNKAYKFKKGSEDFHKTVDTHSKEIGETNKKIDQINTSIVKLFEIIKTQIRYDIVQTSEDAISNGFIEQYRLQSLEDLYTIYSGDVLNGNSYASTMMYKVRKLPLKNID
jgi:hypothetical protein